MQFSERQLQLLHDRRDVRVQRF